MNDEKREEKDLGRIADALEAIERFLVPQSSGFKITQIIGGIMQADITGIQKGAVGTFTGVPTPAGGLTTGVPTWASDDPNTSLTPSADGSAVSVATSATDSASSFNLTQSGQDGKGNPISSSVNVPLLSTAPPPVQASGFNIVQTS
jgi:hypothetical protein